MAPLLALIIMLIPLAIAPGLVFYFDITTKVIVLLAGTAAAVIYWAATGRSSGFLCASRAARWFTWLLIGMAASLVLSTLLSVNPALSLGGSKWRNWGLVTLLAMLLLVWFVAACCAGQPRRLRTILRAVTASGLITAIYGIAQYFGWDPLLNPSAYHVGEGIYRIVRPPSTLGHADYFASWQLCPVFFSAALVLTDKSHFWRRLAWLSCLTWR